MMHYWGDDWPHWNELYAAEGYISSFVYRWSRCRLMMKEKWGSLRYEWLWPPGVGYRTKGNIKMPIFKKKVIKIGDKEFIVDRYLFVWSESWLCGLWTKWGEFIFRIAIKRACKKFPNVIEEIIEDCHWMEYDK